MTCLPMPCRTISTPAQPNTASNALPWPPSGRQSAWKPTGGFFQCPTPYLTLPWALYQHGHLSFLALRTWFGVLELPERRHVCVRDCEVHYSVEELRRLLQVPRLALVQAALHRLEEVGLVAWSTTHIVCFPNPQALCGQDLPAYQTVQAQLPPWRTWVPAPRRLLRWLARDGTPGLCATATGVLLRCLWSKGRRCVSGGRVAARWIATGFGVAERTVHRALDGLQACDWLARLPCTSPADAAQERRYGARTIINLTWDPPVPDTVAIPADAAAATAPGRPRAGRSTCGTSGQTQVVTQGDVVKHAVKHAGILDQNMSSLPPAFDQNMSPTPPTPVPLPPGKSRDSTLSFGADFYPFQEETPDPVPALLARAPEEETPGISHTAHDEDNDTSTRPIAPAIVHPTTLPTNLSADELTAMCAEALAEIPLDDPAAAAAYTFTVLPTATTLALPPAMPLALPLATLVAACATGAPAASSASALPAAAPAVVPAAALLPPAPVPAPPAGSPRADPAALFATLSAAVQEEHLRAARERLLARGFPAALLIRPALLANVYTSLAASSPTPVPVPIMAAGSASVRSAAALAASASFAPAPGSPRGSAPGVPGRPDAAPEMWAAPAAPPCPAVCSGVAAAAGEALPSLSHVVPADLRDRARLEVLRQQAIRRGWLSGSAADRLTFVTAAVHARRVGSDPCALFVAIVRGARRDLLTDGDEDQARAWLTGPPPLPPPPAAAPVPALSDDARFVRLTLAILRQEGWSGDPFVAMQQHSPAWTRTRWDAALAEALGRRVERGLERLGRGLEGEE